MSEYKIEYSPSSRAACRGPKPCYGTKIEKGSLRFGELSENVFDEDHPVWKWRHWGCMTPYLLRQLKKYPRGVHGLSGFQLLRVEDQQRVVSAVERGQVDMADIPASARTFDPNLLPTTPAAAVASSSQASASSNAAGKKRKRVEPPPSSQASTTSRRSDIIELSDSDDDVEVVHMKKRQNIGPSVTQNLTVAGQSTEVIDLSDSDNDEDAGQDEVYTHFASSVVGIKYYSGLVGIGEQVKLIRQPENAYDRNAISVKNISGVQVGHIPKDVAMRLSPLIDRGLITIEGTMTSGNLYGKAGWKLDIDIAIIGPSDPQRRKALEASLIWATPGQCGFEAMKSQTNVAGTSVSAKKARAGQANSAGLGSIDAAKAVQLRNIMENMSRLDDVSRRDTMLNSLCGDDVLELPEYPSPPSRASGVLKNDLLKHQKQGLQWCINAENPVLPKKETDKPVQFWQIQKTGAKTYYYNIATRTPQETAPALGRGGILADDMGLGKTLTLLSLVAATKKDRTASPFCNATLIIVPLSVLSNWETQIVEHFTEDSDIKFHVYYGNGRNVKPSFLEAQDIIITTYQCVVADMPPAKMIKGVDGTETIQVNKAKSGLFAVNWKRICLDEGHTIRNPKTKMAQACYALSAERRWVVSGTPIINNPSDLGSLLRFLRICSPLDKPEFFKRLLSRPLSKRDPYAADLLKALMSSCCIRRTKEMQDKNGKALVPLPPVTFNVIPVKLDEKTREFYDTVEEESRALIQDYLARGANREDMPTGVNVLSMLTRLRQIALDRSLVPTRYLEDLRAAAKAHQHSVAAPAASNISPEEKSRLQDLLAQAIKDCEECPICFEALTDPRITTCAHRFCLECIVETINRQQKCPLDRRQLRVEDLIEPRPPQEDEEQGDDESEDHLGIEEIAPSAKVQQLIQILRVLPSDSKSLVFSQFTSFLDIIGIQLRKESIPYVRFDGTMSASKRKAVLEQFSEPIYTEFDDQETEPETEDEDAYREYIERKRQRRKGKARAVSRFIESGQAKNPVVMLISLKSGALGLNCTVANNVFLMDPFWHDAIESQAIDRVNRLGQKKEVFVYQMVAEDTIEAKVLSIQERKKELVRQAFSGTKTHQTQREKKEARLQELIELFGRRE